MPLDDDASLALGLELSSSSSVVFGSVAVLLDVKLTGELGALQLVNMDKQMMKPRDDKLKGCSLAARQGQ